MASGDILVRFQPNANEPPATNYATLDLRNLHPCLDFDDTTNESAVFSGILPDYYSAGGITVRVIYTMESATTGNVIWESAFEQIGQTHDIDTDSFATAQSSGAVTVPATAGVPDRATIAHTDGAQLDSLAAGEFFRIKLTRDAATDTATGDAEILAVELVES